MAVNELQKHDSLSRPAQKLSPEIQLINLPGGYMALQGAFRKQLPIFIRHYFPVQLTTPLQAQGALEQIIALTLETIKPCTHQPISIQMRASQSNSRYEQILMNIRQIEQRLRESGLVVDDKNPTWALSLYFNETSVFAGVSECVDNLSYYNGGMHRFKRDDGMISRAEFKLLEALSVFGIGLPGLGARALDLGAAPGGWSRILAMRGYRVTSVDPAELSEKLSNHPNITHNKETAQRFFAKRWAVMMDSQYDLIVNDMRMDALDSCRIMLDCAGCLKIGGTALMTLKLPQAHWLQHTQKAVSLLHREYNVAAARQLFHNRSEVTVLLNKSCN